MGQSRNKRYTEEFRKQAVSLVRDGKAVPVVAQEMGVNKNTLYGWVTVSQPSAQSGAPEEAYVKLENENKQLKKENERLKEERTILKKAAAYFAQEMR